MAVIQPHASRLSIARGIPLGEEAGIGALTLGGYLRELTERFEPDEMGCMRAPDGRQMIRWSYRDLWTNAMEVARALAACGVGKGARVGTLTTNRLEFFSSFFGTALAGAIASPFNTFSTSAELEVLLQQSAISVLILERRVLAKDFAAMLVELEPAIATARPGDLQSGKFPFLRHIVLVDDDEGFGAIEGWRRFLDHAAGVEPEHIEARAAHVAPSDPGILFFSSGSTGKPKGILSSHRAVCLQLWRWAGWHNIAEKKRTWSANGFFWSGNFAMVGGTLTTGGTLVLQPTFDAATALALLQEEQVTMLHAWPHQWAQLEALPDWADADLSALRHVTCLTPVKLHPSIVSDWKEPRHAYGNTETFTLITAYPSGTPDSVTRDSHGLPTPGSTVKIVDPMAGETVPVGVRGEIAVKGPTLMLGYVGIPADETLDSEGFFATGDSGYMDDDGRLYWEGRLNDIIKTGGANVSPVEIDTVISQCPGVKASQTVGVPDELLGELVVTCIVLHAGQSLDEAGIRNFAKERLASYKVPRRILLFEEQDFKKTGSAKIIASEARSLAAARLAEMEPV
ncbi:MAG: class I adenylate-forming enzyme family protein [Novosphingobium sp.]